MVEQYQVQALKIDFTKEEIKNIIGPDKYKEIKQIDNYPFFQVYSVCHEGISSPKLLNQKSGPIQWTRAAVQSIKNVITKGIKFFHGHNSDNSIDNREELGEIVGDTQKEIDGKLHHVVVSYHKPEVREKIKEMDICSHEGIWEFIQTEAGLIAGKIVKLSGIAIESSGIQAPAFADSKRLAAIQCYNTTAESQTEVKPMITFNDVKEFINSQQVWPSQIFDIEQVKIDRKFLHYFDQIEQHKKTITAELDIAKKDREVLETKAKELDRITLKTTAAKRLNEIITANKMQLTEKEKRFINEGLDSIDDPSDAGILNHVKKRQEDYNLFVRISSDGNTESDLPTPPTPPTEPATEKNLDYTDPGQNDFI